MDKLKRDPETYRTYGHGRSVRLSPESYSAPGTTYFITACCKDRFEYLRNPATARVVFDVWREVVAQQGYRLWALCVMPDHLHALMESGEQPVSLGTVVKLCKTLCLKRAQADGALAWQAKFRDEVLPPRDDAKVRARYIADNPVRAGFVERYDQWPWTYMDPEVFA